MTGSPSVTAPRGLGTAGRRLWRQVLAEHDFRADELVMFGHVCRMVDEEATMAEALSDAGPVVAGSMGQTRAHPLITEIRAHRLAIARLLSQLDIPDPDEDAADAPAPVAWYAEGSTRRARAVRARLGTADGSA